MCFHIGSTLANVPSGTMVDLTGRRVVFQVAALVIGSLTLLGIGIFEAYAALAAMVAVMGAANMMWHPAAISFLSGHLPKNRGYALSIHALGANLGDAVAPPFVGWMMLSASWRTAAEVNALTGFLCAAAILLCLSQGDGIGVNKGKGLDLKSYFGGMARALKARAVWSLCLMAGFRTMTQGGLMMFLPLYLANDLKLNPFLMGVALMMLQVGGMIASPVAGMLSDRIGRRPIVLAGMAGTTLLVLGLTLIDNTSVFITCVSFLGFVMYAMRPVIHSWLMDRTPPELAASMTSAMFGTQAALSALTPVIGGFLADAYGLLSVFYFLAAMVLIANLLALAVPKSETAA
jgi:MFS family permease